jgi:endonuclease/exonuclease/phosphatase (EEP) superfamily protein YafD
MRRIVGAVNVVLTLVVLAAAIAAVAALGQAQDPRLELLAQFQPVYGAVGLVGLAWALVAGRGPIVAAIVVAVAASAWLIVPEFTRYAGPTARAGMAGQIKVIQFNALHTNRGVDPIADWLDAQQPDVITLSEARHELRDLLVRRGWKVAGAKGSLMIFTRAPYRRMDRPRVKNVTLLTFVNATYARPGGEMEVFTTHVDRHTRQGLSALPGTLATLTAGLPTPRMILTGDFNATPWTQALRRTDAALGLTRRDRAVATWPAQVMGKRWPLPILPIDHVYAGPDWATVKVERGPWLGSDHYPLIVTLAPVGPR